MPFSKKAECIRRVINNSSKNDFYKFDNKSYNASKIKEFLEINSPKLAHLIKKIKELDENDLAKYGKNFKHIIYSDFRSSIAGIKLVASVFKAYGMKNIYNEKLKINIPNSNDNFALLSSVAIYNKPFPVKLRNEIIKIFNERPENIYGEKIRFLLLDQGFKEGIDCFDVKYVHIFDDLISPADQKQVIGRGTRFCGQKGLEFNPEVGWPLHVFKYKLNLNDNFEEKDAFMLFIKEEKIDIKKLFFAAELENICRFGAVDYEINKAIHEFGNDKEDSLDKLDVFERFRNFVIKDMYNSLDNKGDNDFALMKKAYKKFGGVGGIIKKNKRRFIDIKKVKSIGRDLKKKLDFVEMRKYIRRYFKDLKWKDLEFKNGCVSNGEIVKSRFATLNNSQNFVSEYFRSSSIYKGILFWHSVGTGKTCSAIATASKSFEKDGYTILWVTRHTLKPDIWKNMYSLICSSTIKEKIENGVNIPENMNGNYLKYLDNRWVMPVSYKQFSNLVAGKNEFYKELVRRNGKTDPLKKTLIIIDEAHKLFAEDTPAAEKADIKLLKSAIYKSYNLSNEDSCRLLLMTATPYTNDPIQLFKLLNLLRTDDYFPEDFEEFKQIYLDDNYKFKKGNGEHKQFLDKITGYISYLNREKDARQFAYPVIYNEEVPMSASNNQLIFDVYKKFMEDIDKYIDINIDKAKELLEELKEQIKEDKKNSKKTNEDISQEDALLECINGKVKNDDNPIKEANEYAKAMVKILKEKEKELKELKKKKAKGDFQIIDKTEDFIEFELFYQIQEIIAKFDNGEEIDMIGIRVKASEFEKFEELGEGIIDNGLEDGILIKNTKKECILDAGNIRFEITHKKVKKDVIYILSPTPKIINDYKIINKKSPSFIEIDILKQIQEIIKKHEKGEKIDKIKIKKSIETLENFEEIGKNIVEKYYDLSNLIKNSKTECILQIDNIKFVITYEKDKKSVIYIITPTPIIVKEVAKDFKIVDGLPKFDIEEDIFFNISSFNKKIGIKKDISRFYDFDKLGDKLVARIKDVILSKNTNKECVIYYNGNKYVITYEKDKTSVIYIITPFIIKRDNMIIPLDHSLNKKQVEKYINACDLETRPILRKIFDNTSHISYENFIQQLNKNLKKLATLTKELFIYVSMGYSDKSNYWIYLYIRDYFEKNYPSHNLELIQNLKNNKNGDFIILVDDCIYSGSQMGEQIIEEISNPNNLQLNFYLLCPYITKKGLDFVKKCFNDNNFLIDNKCQLIDNNNFIYPTLIDDVLTNEDFEILNKYLKDVKGTFLIYFDHKLADPYSTITYIYSGFVLNKKNSLIIKERRKLIEGDYIPVINNCEKTKNIDVWKPACPFTPYKKTFKDFIKEFNDKDKFKSSPLKSKKKRILNKSI